MEYGLGGSGNREFAKKHDNILFYKVKTTYLIYSMNLLQKYDEGKMKKMKIYGILLH